MQKNPVASVATALKSGSFHHGGGEFSPVSKTKRRREKNQTLKKLVKIPVCGTKLFKNWCPTLSNIKLQTSYVSLKIDDKDNKK